jgi:N-acetyltransferase
MIKRTYSRRKPLSIKDELPSKRRRVEARSSKPPTQTPGATTASSSPIPDRALDSDDFLIKSTPPSSPPPLSQLQNSSPLKDIAHTTRQPQTKPVSQSKSKKPQKLTQLTLDLGQSTRKKCRECGMTYTLSNVADVALHKKYHAQNLFKGIELSRRFTESAQTENKVWSGPSGDIIVSVSRSASSFKKKAAEMVMGVVEEELRGAGVDMSSMWSEMDLPEEGEEGRKNKRGDRYKAFLYTRAGKCVGFCLAERISSAFSVLDTNTITRQPQHSHFAINSSSSITTSTVPSPATLSISRIWTSPSVRRTGIAVDLLNCARRNFLYGITIKKANVAFSQPTESGGKLARKWFGKDSGWLVSRE